MKLRSAIEAQLFCFISFISCALYDDEEDTIDGKERSKADKHDSTITIFINEVELNVAIKIIGISLLAFNQISMDR